MDIETALQHYFEGRVNFGPDDRATRLAEEDAFRAGWAAHTWTAAGVTA